MAKITGKDGAFLLDKYDLSGEGNNTGVDVAVDAHEASAYGLEWKDFLEGLPGWTLSHDSWFDGDSNKADEVSQALIGAAEKLFGLYPEGMAAGKQGYEGKGILGGKSVTVPVNGVVALSLSAQSKGSLNRTKVLAKSDISGSGNGASQDFGQAGSKAVTAVLRVLAYSGSATVTVKVQESVNESSWDDLITFTAVTGTTAERKVSATAGKRYLRATWSFGANATTATILVAAENK